MLSGSSRKQHLRLRHQRARQRHSLLLPAAQVRRQPIRQGAETQSVENPRDPLADLGAARLLRQRISDVLKNRHMRPDGVGLKDHADVAPLRRNECAVRRAVNRMIVDQNFPGQRLLQSGDAAKRRRFAAAARTEQGKQFALAHFEGHAAERLNFAPGAGK